MDYENYMELYEAVYFFDRINSCVDNILPHCLYKEEIEKLGINQWVYQALIRILVAANLLKYNGSSFMLSPENQEKYQYIRNHICKAQKDHYQALFAKAVNKTQFFFDGISEAEYEIYSRYNFQLTFETGKVVANHVNFTNTKVLELGGNSGGLGTALVSKYSGCVYTVVDTKIPCIVGTELKKINHCNLTFIEGNIFHLELLNQCYHYIILMNLLHDFDDKKCLNILSNCLKYCGNHTKFLIIEDVLTSEFEPKEVIMHGLRLSVECRGGRQRTLEELGALFFKINYKLEEKIPLGPIHTMLVMGLCSN